MDGVHWADTGVVIHKDEGAVWLGSGSVLQTSNGTYVMNFSEEYDCEGKSGKQGDGCQSIFFATTTDLEEGWRRVPFQPPPANDPNVFKYGKGYRVGGRWDCIATVPKPGAPGLFYGYWTATPDAGVGAGVGQTVDQSGMHWEALPPITTGFPSGEVGSVVVHEGRYFMLFGGGHLYTSTNPIADFVIDPHVPEFNADGYGVAFTRLWNTAAGENDSVMVSHQWVVRPDIYLAPLKQGRVGTDGTMRATYWSGNEQLKGEPISLSPATEPIESMLASECSSNSTHWSAPTVGEQGRPISTGNMCMAQFGGVVRLTYCKDSSLLFTARTDGRLVDTQSGLCLGLSPGAVPALIKCTANTTVWDTTDGMIEFVTKNPLQPDALWLFDSSIDLGRNSGAKSSRNASLQCQEGGICTQKAIGPRKTALSLSGGSYLGFENGTRVPEGVPIGNQDYTVAGWVLPDQSNMVHIRRDQSNGVMMGMVGWGDFETPLRSNAFATSLPGGFWNYW